MCNSKLLQPGWAGELNKSELAFIRDKLKRDRRLRAKWGMGRGKGYISELKIRRVALYGPSAVDGSGECVICGCKDRISLLPDVYGPVNVCDRCGKHWDKTSQNAHSDGLSPPSQPEYVGELVPV